MVYPALLPVLPLMPTSRLPVVDGTDAPADINGLVRFAGRQNLVAARVPSHFKCSLALMPEFQQAVVGAPSPLPKIAMTTVNRQLTLTL